MTLTLGWGRSPLSVQVPESTRTIVGKDVEEGVWGSLIDEALSAPVASAPLRERVAEARSICILMPDSSRKGVARHMLPPVLAQIPEHVSISLGVAGGKHPPEAPPASARVLVESRGGTTWSHDAYAEDLVEVGRTDHGTVVCYPSAVVEADLVITLGEIRPHYFAGYAGGYKGLFPGAAGAPGIWHNHTLKAAPGARLGVVEGNPCRADLEAAGAMAGPAFIVNVVRGSEGGPVAVVAGDPVEAHRVGVMRARELFEVQVSRKAPVVMVSDRWPVTMNLYQACKLLVPAGRVLEEGGTIILAAACEEGLGPIDVINDKIYRLGIVHSLPEHHRVILVSTQPSEKVALSFADYAPDIATALEMAGAGPLLVMPRAGELVPVMS
ncbi:MAG: lactate racemase domain-containing protein [Bradymonadia bacterium]